MCVVVFLMLLYEACQPVLKCFVCLSVPLAMESLGFLDALNSAPVPGIKIKKKKPKAVSPTSNKVGWK